MKFDIKIQELYLSFEKVGWISVLLSFSCYCYLVWINTVIVRNQAPWHIWKGIHLLLFLFEIWLYSLIYWIYFGRYSSACYLFSFCVYQNHKVEYHIKVCISYSGDVIFSFTLKCPEALNLFCIHVSNWKKELCSGRLKMKTAENWGKGDAYSSLSLVPACGAHDSTMKNEFCAILIPLLEKIEVWTWGYFSSFMTL